jgi:methyl-accepting chemotaxis protein
MFRSLSPKHSLSSKLILFSLFILCVPMLFLTLITNSIANENLHTIAHDRIEAQTAGSVEQIELYLTERKGDVSFFATLLTVRSLLQGENDRELRQELAIRLETARDTYEYDAISVLDTNGIVVVSTDEDLLGLDRGAMPEVRSALNGERAISDIRIEAIGDNAFFHTTAPVYEDGEIIGVVDARAATNVLDEIVASDENSTGAGSYSVLLDEALIRISIPTAPSNRFVPEVALSPEVEQRMVAEQRFGSATATLLGRATNATDIATNAAQLHSNTNSVFFESLARSANEEEETQSVLRKLDIVPWYYLHHVPQSSFNSIVNEQTEFALGITGLAAVLAIIAMIVFASISINKPLNRLVHTAQALQSGDLSKRLVLRREDEIGKLAASFNDMADSLEKRLKAEQEAQEEARQLQETETANREMLEQTVAHYLAFMQDVSKGDLTTRLNVSSDGAMGTLGHGLNTMVGNLHTLTREVQQASTSIAAAASEILAATTQQASSATEQSSAITQTSTTVEEVKTIARQTAQQAEQVANDSQEALSVARQGTQSVEETISSMNRIRERVEGIAQTILALSEQTQAIGAITQTVAELADQSNLLALNAAIEAARAGEQGKSFAVVAQQVRDLAERSKTATGRVSEILEEIQRATNAAVMVTEEGSKGVESGTRLASEAGQVIHRIAVEVEGGAQANVQMAAAANQQTTGMEQIGQAMTSIQQATTQALASTRQAEGAARDLHTLAQSLQETIAAYRV